MDAQCDFAGIAHPHRETFVGQIEILRCVLYATKGSLHSSPIGEMVAYARVGLMSENTVNSKNLETKVRTQTHL